MGSVRGTYLPRSATIALLVVAVVGCGPWPPIVKSSEGVRQLPGETRSVRARGLDGESVHLLGRLRDLEQLDFGGGHLAVDCELSDAGIDEVCSLGFVRLTHLSIGRCPNVTDAGLEGIARLPSLTHLMLPGCAGVTDVGVEYISRSRTVVHLDLRGCPNVSDLGLNYLVDRGGWDTLLLGGCAGVSDADVQRLRNLLPHAQVEKDDDAWELER
jgi:Leucine Rich repeat